MVVAPEIFHSRLRSSGLHFGSLEQRGCVLFVKYGQKGMAVEVEE